MSEPAIDWAKTHQMIHSWLRERHEVLVLFTDLCQQQPKLDSTHTKQLLNAFCQLLIDYVSCGQFAIYEVIATANASRKTPGKILSTKLMQALLNTTFEATVFNDKYDKNPELDTLNQDLNHLGEVLANRLDLEDELLSIYADAAEHLNAVANEKV